MPELTIDGRPLAVPAGTTLLEAARGLGLEIPTLCFLDGHPHHTSCMVCLVEEAASGAMLPACATPAADGQNIRTGGERVTAARRRSLELLLSEHSGDCEAPCTRACPAHPNLPGLIRRVARRELAGALAVLLERLPLAGTLSAICPAPCERACRRAQVDTPVAIRSLKRAAARAGLGGETPITPRRARDSGRSVAVVGAGPAGLAAAYFLLIAGHRCTIIDEHRRPGGALLRLEAEGRLPEAVLSADLAVLERLGVSWQIECAVTPESVPALREAHDALVLAPGSPERLAALVPAMGFDRPTTAGTAAGVFACGNATRSRPSLLAVQAVADGRRAALAAAASVMGLSVQAERRRVDSRLGALSREELTVIVAESRRWAERSGGGGAAPEGPVDLPARPGEAHARQSAVPRAATEALRCLRCDCTRKASCGLRELAGRYGADLRRFPAEESGGKHPIRGERLGTSGGLSFEPGKCIKCGICVRIAERAGATPGLAFSGRGYDLRLRVPFAQDLERALGPAARDCVRHCPTGALAWHRQAPSDPFRGASA